MNGNYMTVKTANIAIKMIKEKLLEDVKSIYVYLTKNYTYKDSVKNIYFSNLKIRDNEMKELYKEKYDKLKINHSLVSGYLG